MSQNITNDTQCDVSVDSSTYNSNSKHDAACQVGVFSVTSFVTLHIMFQFSKKLKDTLKKNK